MCICMYVNTFINIYMYKQYMHKYSRDKCCRPCNSQFTGNLTAFFQFHVALSCQALYKSRTNERPLVTFRGEFRSFGSTIIIILMWLFQTCVFPVAFRRLALYQFANE